MAKVIDKNAYFARIGHQPHHKQWLYHKSQARFRIACCGRRFGKSLMAARDLEPELLLPDRRYWIVGPTYDLAEKEFRYIWKDMIIGLKLGRDKRVKKAYNKRSGEMYIEFPTGTRLECKSAKHPETLVGDGLHGVIMSEAAKHTRETWEQYIRAALADYRGWATFVTTPEGFNWLYDLWMLGPNPNEPDFESWRFPSWDNPIVYPGGRDDQEIKLIERTTAPEWFMQEYGAEFGAFVGKVYGEFDPHVHILKQPYKFNPDWPNYICFDWGFAAPFAAIEFQVDPQDRVYVWREHYKAGLTHAEHMAIMRNRPQPEGYRLDCGFGDAADPQAAKDFSTNFIGTYALPEAKKNWREGVDLVKTWLKLQEVYTAAGSLVVCDEYGTPQQAPRLWVAAECENLIKEFNNYRIADHRPDVNPREAAKAFANHALDALRYGMMHVFKLGCTYHLADFYGDERGLDVRDDLQNFLPRGAEGFFTAGGLDFSASELDY